MNTDQLSIDDYLRNWFHGRSGARNAFTNRLWESMEYSVFSGGKRFRPVLALQTARMLSVGSEKVLPFAAAVEMIHTYSLVHDDLPVMDNDDLRRGQPTNHRKFDEVTALLAGDSLLTEAFLILGHAYRETPEIGLRLVENLSLAAGPSGMVAGQVMDLQARMENMSAEELIRLHSLKTGELIAVAVTGVGIIARLPESVISLLNRFGHAVGLAFQIADDLLDHTETKAEPSGLPRLIGVKECRALLEQTSKEALSLLSEINTDNKELAQLVLWNSSRLF